MSRTTSSESTSTAATAEQQLLQQLIDLIQSGVNPWQRPWHDPVPFQNLCSGHKFSGSNPALLHAQCVARGIDDRFFATATQARAHGWFPAKGSKAFRIYQPTPVTVGGPKAQGPGAEATATGQADQPSRSFFRYRCIPIFAVSDLVLSDPDAKAISPADAAAAARQAQTPPPPSVVDPDVLSTLLKPIGRWMTKATHVPGGSSAFYDSRNDRISVPTPDSFRLGIESYVATIAHELGHLTGHSSRLNRPGITEWDGRSSERYAEEELIAEIASFLTCEELGVASSLENHASYLDHWARILGEGPKALTAALSAAARAKNYLFAPDSHV